MRSLCLFFLCLACSSPSAPSTILQPTSVATSQASAIVQPVAKKTKLDLSGEFSVRFTDVEYLRHPTNVTIIIRSDGSMEMRQKVEMVYDKKKGETVFKEYPGDGKVTTGTVTEAEIASLKSILESEAFFALEESYNGKMYDVPSYTLHVQNTTQSKSFHISGTLLKNLPPILQSAISYTRSVAAKLK